MGLMGSFMWWRGLFSAEFLKLLDAAYRQNHDEIACRWQCLNYLVRLPVGSNHVPLAVPDKQQYFHSGSLSYLTSVISVHHFPVLSPWDIFIREQRRHKDEKPRPTTRADVSAGKQSHISSIPATPLSEWLSSSMVGNMHVGCTTFLHHVWPHRVTTERALQQLIYPN